MKKNNKKNIKNVISISQPSLSTPSVAIEKSIKNNGISWGTFWTVILTSNTIILAFLIPIIFYYKSKNDASYLYCKGRIDTLSDTIKANDSKIQDLTNKFDRCTDNLESLRVSNANLSTALNTVNQQIQSAYNNGSISFPEKQNKVNK